MFKVRVFVDHRLIGYVREVHPVVTDGKAPPEFFVSATMLRATRFTSANQLGMALTLFQTPDRVPGKKVDPKVTFEIINC